MATRGGQSRGQSWQGAVEGYNDKGLKLDGEWYNYSNYFKGDKTARKGDTIVAVLDGRFINEIDIVGSAREDSRSGGSVQTAQSSAGVDWEAKDMHIRRQVALKAAVETTPLLIQKTAKGAGIEVTVEGIIEVSRQFEAYLNEPVRSDEEPEELPY